MKEAIEGGKAPVEERSTGRLSVRLDVTELEYFGDSEVLRLAGLPATFAWTPDLSLWLASHRPDAAAVLQTLGLVAFCDPGANLEGVFLVNAHLERSLMAGAHMSGAQMARVKAARASFRHTDLSGAMLVDADLRGADLRGANLRGADLRRADLRGADLRGACTYDADMTGVLE